MRPRLVALLVFAALATFAATVPAVASASYMMRDRTVFPSASTYVSSDIYYYWNGSLLRVDYFMEENFCSSAKSTRHLVKDNVDLSRWDNTWTVPVGTNPKHNVTNFNTHANSVFKIQACGLDSGFIQM